MTMHPEGFLFVSLPNGFGVFAPDGELLGTISVGQVTNLALDASATRLFVTTPQRLLMLHLAGKGQ